MVAKMHRIHMPKIGEGVVYVPGGVPFETDAKEEYPIGSYIRLGNKGFVYAESAGITDCSKGVKQSIRQTLGWSSIGADALVGAIEVVVTVGSDQGPSSNGNITKDYFKGGEIMIGDTGSRLNVVSRGITGNTVLTGGTGGDMTVTLDAPIPVALVEDTSVAELIVSPYRGVKTDVSSSTPVMGLPTCLAADGKFLWLQVEGINGQVMCQTDVGDGPARFQGVFRNDGTIGPHDDSDSAEEYQQHAGFVVALNAAGGQGLPFVMLQIAH